MHAKVKSKPALDYNLPSASVVGSCGERVPFSHCGME